jgi:7,8-dihydropterin-6-yl-methyl-4-(beta-D-ribofuranosyl)aminobenzene 5'-phosphate synthase
VLDSEEILKITCVVDDRGYSDSALRAEHGASFLIEAGSHTVLFDTGQSGEALLHNLAALGVSPQQIEALILSHAHYDHTGGLPALLEQVQGIPLFAHPDLFRKRFRKTDTGPRQVGPSMTRKAVAPHVVLRLHAEPVEVVPGVWTTGDIGARSEPEGRGPYHFVRQGAGWIEDPYRDDLSVVLETEEGLVLLCGCCHAGLLNTLAHVRATFGHDPLAVIGGLHLLNADAPTLDHVIETLRDYGPPRLWVGHCTGDRSFLRLKAAFGDRVSLYHVGTELTL